MLKQADKLIRRLQLACKGHEEIAVFAALETAMEGVLEQTRNDQLRNHLTIRLIYMLLSLPVFAELERSGSQQGLAAIAAVSDVNARNAAALSAIRTLASFSTPLSTDVHYAARSELLGRRYAAANDDADKLISRLFNHAAGAASLIQCLTDGDLQIRTILMYVQAVIAMPEFTTVDTVKLKQVLRSVADIPDDEFRDGASLEHIDRFLEVYSQQSGWSR